MMARNLLPAALAAALASLGSLASAQAPPLAAQRQLALAHSPCPDKRSATACKSFQELLRDNDPGLLSDLAHQDHLYVCFLLNVDEFFKVTWSIPPATAFTAPSAAQIKQGVPATASVAPGASDFAYFRIGVRDPDSSLRDPGIWTSLPQTPPAPASAPQSPNLRQAHFKGKTIEISADEWKLTETYPNDTGSLIRHTVTLQLANGRFRQEFALADSGKIQAQNDGRCLIAPALQ